MPAAASTNALEPKRLLSASSIGALMFVELCKQRAAEFMQELLKPVFNTIFRFGFARLRSDAPHVSASAAHVTSRLGPVMTACCRLIYSTNSGIFL